MARRKSRRNPKQGPDELVVIPAEYFRLTYSKPEIAAGPEDKELVPRLVREYIPYSLIKSLSLAIDPFWKFKASRVIITPVNRTRRRTIDSILSNRSVTAYRYSRTVTTTYTTVMGCNAIPTTAVLQTKGTTVLGKSTGFSVRTLDTTARTRPYKSELGEFETFSYLILSPARSVSRFFNTQSYGVSLVCPGRTNTLFATDNYREVGDGDAATLSASTIEGVRNTDAVTLLAEMQKKALGMLPKVLPERRHNNVYRSVVELKDLPRGILQLQKTITDFRALTAHLDKSALQYVTDLRATAKNVPKEWLSFNFGWKQIYRDAVELLLSPERITRDINRLIERNGKPTTHRLRQRYAVDSVTTPSFSYPTYSGEQNVTLASNRVRQIELRMMVNATFDFPPLAVPQLRDDLWKRKLGLRPSFTDLYNLIPWTWLVDWFTGLGQYIEAIDSINTDRSTFNYGFLTGTLTSVLTTVRTSRTRSTTTITFQPNPGTVYESFTGYVHSSVLESKLTIRKDISSAYGAKALLVGNTLTPYQTSILGALLSGRTKLAR